MSGAWITSGRTPDLLAFYHLPDTSGIVIALVFAAVALIIARRNSMAISTLLFGCGIVFAMATGWYLTYAVSRLSFDPVPVGSLTFSGPPADTLMYLLSANAGLDFDVGLVLGVFIAAFYRLPCPVASRCRAGTA